MDKKMIIVAKEFSETPAGRHITDGPYSGEAFRERLLYPALMEGSRCVEVDLDGALGYGSSFLEEAFGGLVREKHMHIKDLKERLMIKSTRRLYRERIWSYIQDAEKQACKQ